MGCAWFPPKISAHWACKGNTTVTCGGGGTVHRICTGWKCEQHVCSGVTDIFKKKKTPYSVSKHYGYSWLCQWPMREENGPSPNWAWWKIDCDLACSKTESVISHWCHLSMTSFVVWILKESSPGFLHIQSLFDSLDQFLKLIRIYFFIFFKSNMELVLTLFHTATFSRKIMRKVLTGPNMHCINM